VTLSPACWSAVAGEIRPYVRSRVGSDADADDVMQEVLLRMHRGLAALRDEQRLTSWAFGIARRAIADHGRARGRMALPTEPAVVDAEFEDEPNTDEASADALTSVIAGFVAALPSPYREAVTLTELEGCTHAQAASMLGISLTAMKSRVRRGRQKLRQSLERCCAIELDARNRVVEVVPRPDGQEPAGCCAD
jgi:RNA polymerase sigma-70 factor, ECF subfamily